jgi:pimeloyl-ACP methyl ester carboxylesterase
MNLEKYLTGKRKNALIGILMLASFFILVPSFAKVIAWQMAPFTDDEVAITTVTYKSEDPGGSGYNLVVGNLFQPSPKFSDKTYPGIIAVHGFLFGIGKESMNRWCVELAKRDFVVLSLDMPGNGMSMGDMDIIPRADYESVIIKNGINYLRSLDFVNNSIGLIGISYGGGIVSMSAGKLGNLVNATISLNGFTNLTNVLINGALTQFNVGFTVSNDYITLKTVSGNTVTAENIHDIVRLYGIIKGNEEDFDGLIVPGTRHLNRTFLKRFDAVEYLDNVRNGSMMFIHSTRDNSFSYTNQSGQGYDAIRNAGKNATYISVDDNHQLMDDPNYTSDYCIINFFEEKLMGVDLGNFANDTAKYSQKRDIILTYSLFFGFNLVYELIITFFISLIPAFLVISIIFYNKKIATRRVRKEESILEQEKKDEVFVDYTFGRGSYGKTLLYLTLAFLITYTFIIGTSLGFFSDLIVGTFCAGFYLVLFLSMYFVPDQAEVDRWDNLKEERSPYIVKTPQKDVKVFDINSFIVLFIVIAILIGGAYIGVASTNIPAVFKKPLELAFTPLIIIGATFLITGILFIYILEKKENEGIKFKQIQWSRYTLDKYQIVKSFTYGSVLFLSFFFSWNIWAFFMKFPMMMGPHSVFYIYMVLALILFFGGFQVIIKILKEKFIKDNMEIPEKITAKKLSIEILTVIIGSVLCFIVIYIAFNPLFTSSLFGDLTVYIALLIALIYLLTNVIKIFCVDRGIFGITIFFPLFIFGILGFLLHI